MFGQNAPQSAQTSRIFLASICMLHYVFVLDHLDFCWSVLCDVVWRQPAPARALVTFSPHHTAQTNTIKMVKHRKILQHTHIEARHVLGWLETCSQNMFIQMASFFCTFPVSPSGLVLGSVTCQTDWFYFNFVEGCSDVCECLFALFFCEKTQQTNVLYPCEMFLNTAQP